MHYTLLLSLSLISLLVFPARAQQAEPDLSGIKTVYNLPYKSGQQLSAYEKERAYLDLYLPEGQSDFPVLVWLHGGGLKINSKDSLESRIVGIRMAKEGVGVAIINYRLSPEGQYPDYIEDVAAATAWVHQHIKEYQGNPEKLYLGGHSAGGYLAAIATLDASYLQAYDMQPGTLEGIICISGQMDSHNTVKEEKGIAAEEKIIDASAPLYHTATDVPPFLILYADDDIPGRGAINEEFARAMKKAGHKLKIKELKNKDHLSIVMEIMEPKDATARQMLSFIKK
ncbi:alpha/beta hydrolase [Porifericola rhodea]|uniref:alpha/beta hydrolase n=1 Tax=Porifericola rhodea TaxID=930972 RepID=UPI0026658DA2|nr:alpha/beta hydrolase [Porifericola rhodea]WKN33855.1 alpha/beta hydrolase [Porifericola rhodea]